MPNKIFPDYVLNDYTAAQNLITDDYAIDLSCTDFPDLASFITAIDAALDDMLDDMIESYRLLKFTLDEPFDRKRIRAYYAANDILTYDIDYILFADRETLDRILAREDSADLLA